MKAVPETGGSSSEGQVQAGWTETWNYLQRGWTVPGSADRLGGEGGARLTPHSSRSTWLASKFFSIVYNGLVLFFPNFPEQLVLITYSQEMHKYIFSMKD